MRKGFTLVELLVVVAIMGLLSGGAVVYINRGRSAQRVMAAKNEILANIRMARNYAVSLQDPEGYTGEMTAVGVGISSDGTMTVYPLPYSSGVNYFVRSVATDGVGVTVSSNYFFFSAYEGKVSKGSSRDAPVVLGVGETVRIMINSTEGESTSRVIIISGAGLINEVE